MEGKDVVGWARERARGVSGLAKLHTALLVSGCPQDESV